MNKHEKFIFRETDPLNGGSPPEVLRQQSSTPNDQFFIRNHGAIPEIDPATFALHIEGAVERPLRLTLDSLRGFAHHTVSATLQCAGNRRQELARLQPIPNEVVWGTEAVSHAEWGGVLLRDVLQETGYTADARHVAFLGIDEPEKAPGGFGGSIPLEAALNSPVLLADTMNGQPLPPTHGYPLRVIAPGYIGARSVKWLSKILLQAEPSENYYQQHGYRLFSPSADPDTVEADDGIMLGELPVNSIIWQPLEDETLQAGAVTVRGHAYVGGGRTIERVEVSADGGKTWLRAAFDAEPQPYVWTLWQANVHLPEGEHQLVVRAWDSSANSQPESVESVWNFKGYMNNAYHRIQVSAI